MDKSRSGFTIVELLIVIVVIAILATISIVAYSGIQQRARNSIRAQDIASIQKALEFFRIQHGRYPFPQPPGTNLPPGFTSPYSTTSGYSYSAATDNSWLQELRTSGLMSTIPKDPLNGASNYYIYIAYDAGVGSCIGPFYALIVRGWEGGVATMPASSQTLNCSLSGVVTASWGEDGNQAVFSNLNHPTGS